MIVSYFPGCTLKTKAKVLDKYARLSAEKLGVTLEEIDNWQCCGGVFTSASDEIATKLSSVRALRAAEKKEQILVTACSACHNVIKRTNAAFNEDETFRTRVNNYMKEDLYEGTTEVMFLMELFRDKIGFDKIKEAVVNPLKGRRIGAYYGCLLLRPSQTMKFDDPENPKALEEFIKALGATPVSYAMRNECCGGYMTMTDKALADKKSSAIHESAAASGAELLVTACPLCRYNLEKSSAEAKVPVVYFTELLAEALGIKEE